ncbi:MAG: DUF1836 domain-containing protein [Peptococcaceae bacterium]|jgi:hypothetical protein|nr:DUF1836 domain-containing protein [Peptococcaceae bacterium]MBQ2035972.1 DUF1836 domain-containing protein [Peptococcaceae bacterium]MBQ5653077.1 DUF1836 domain-containing protein [Peptococcaceae bacterium]MBQ5703236.1 DUF1836 domain-containing protein [Peptococcaceae bacterium]
MPDEHKMLVWLNEIQQYRLPRWEELPDIELYMDQVITLIERYLTPLVGEHDSKVITPAMINNYVKLNIMPKPIKKRYERTHLAYLIVITILKQVILITEVKEGIFLQSKLCSIPEAYNIFCDMQEKALSEMAEIYTSAYAQKQPQPFERVALDSMGLYMACTSFAGKIFTEKIIFTRHEDRAAILPSEDEE